MECCSLNWGFNLLMPNKAMTSLVCSNFKASMNYSLLILISAFLPCLLKSSINCSRKVAFLYLD